MRHLYLINTQILNLKLVVLKLNFNTRALLQKRNGETTFGVAKIILWRMVALQNVIPMERTTAAVNGGGVITQMPIANVMTALITHQVQRLLITIILHFYRAGPFLEPMC